MIGDVTDEQLWADADLTGLTHAVVNAGIGAGGPIEELSFAEWRRVLSVNLDGAFLTLQAAMRAIRAAARAARSSSPPRPPGVKAEPGIAAYGASKAAVIHLARIAAKEGAAAGIRVNSIAPGGVETPIWAGLALLPGPGRIDRQRGGRLQGDGGDGDAARPLRQAGGDRRADRLPALRRGRLHHRRLPGQRWRLFALASPSLAARPRRLRAPTPDARRASRARPTAAACEQRRFEGSAFTLCRYDRRRDEIALLPRRPRRPPAQPRRARERARPARRRAPLRDERRHV